MRFIAPKRLLFFGAALLSMSSLLVIDRTSSALKTTHATVRSADAKTAVKLVRPLVVKPIPPPDPDTSSFRKLVVKNLGPVVNNSAEDFGPTITADGRTMYFVSRRSGGKGADDFWFTHS